MTKKCPLKKPACTLHPCRKKRKCSKASGRCREGTPVYSGKTCLDISTEDEFVFLPIQDVSRQSVYSFGIVNRGENPVEAIVQIGPTRVDFTEDVQEVIQGGQTSVLVPVRFVRYVRLGVRSVEEGKGSVVDVYFQTKTTA